MVASVHTRNAISRSGRRSRAGIAVAIIALLGLVPLSTLGGGSSATSPASGLTNAPAPAAQAAAPLQPVPVGAPAVAPANRPTPDQVPLVAYSGATSGARLVLSAPRSVAVGQTLTIVLRASGVKNLAGYEGVLRFDGAAAEFDSLSQRQVALAGLGRDVEPLGPVVVPAGVAFGLYSCSLAGCGGTNTKTSHPGASGTVALAKLTLLPTVAGKLSIGLGAMRFVDAAGKLMTIKLPGTISVQVGTAGPSHPAPAVAGSGPCPCHDGQQRRHQRRRLRRAGRPQHRGDRLGPRP